MILSLLDDFKFFTEAKKINKIFTKTKIKSILTEAYISDGGPGFLNTDLLKNYKKKKILIKNSHLVKINSYYRFDDKEKNSYIELSKIIGKELVKKKKNYFKKSSYGLGEVVKKAIHSGSKKIYIGLGGCDATDIGIGFLSALGVTFKKNDNTKFNPLKDSWDKVSKLEKSSFNTIKKKYKNIKIILLVDVLLPLYGNKGSTKMFGLQKGAKKTQLKFIDNLVKKYFKMLKHTINKNLDYNYHGSSSGIPISVSLLFNTEIYSGIKYFLNKSKISRLIEKKKIKYVLTGEGRLDNTSLLGKFTIEILKFAKKKKLFTIGIFGQVSNHNLIKNFNKTFVLNKEKVIFLNKKYKLNNFYKKKIKEIGNSVYELVKKNEI